MSIQLHCDLQVASGHEAEIERVFTEVFSPVMAQQKGFEEVKFLKLVTSYKGDPAPWNYRLLIGFETEELRQAWVASDDHQRVWPEMEKHLTGEQWQGWLYSVAGSR
jgi:heme-degrading monooxygenase HmoA